MILTKQLQKSPHFCVKCNKSYSCQANLLNHNYHFHNDKGAIKLYQCTKCEKNYSRPGSLSNHIKSHHSSVIFKCPHCQKVLSCKGHLKRHLNSVHNNTKRLNQCYFCASQSKGYIDNSALFAHIRRVHLKERPYKCRKNSKCAKVFPSCSYAITHTICKTKEGYIIPNTRTKVCYFCSQSFYKNYSLQRHLCKEHTGEIHYRCNFCSHPFYSAIELEHHIFAKHTRELYHKCKYCEYKAVYPRLLSEHVNWTHTKRFLYECYFCKLPFQRFSHLRTHMECHTKECLVLSCYFCQKVYKSKPRFLVHLKTKHLKESVRVNGKNPTL